MKKVRSLYDLRVWVKAKDLVIEIYKLTSLFPTREKFGLISQLCRAAVSVMASIAEGFYRQTTKELISFLVNARGSAGEVISHLIISAELKYITKERVGKLISEYEHLIISINSLIKSLRKKK